MTQEYFNQTGCLSDLGIEFEIEYGKKIICIEENPMSTVGAYISISTDVFEKIIKWYEDNK